MTTFELTEDEEKKVDKWIKKQKKKDNSSFTLGERWTYSFTPTGIGIIKKVIDNKLGEELDITDYDWW